MTHLFLKLLGMSEVQWEWKKRRWQEHGIFSWKRRLSEAEYPALFFCLILIGILYLVMVIANGGNPFAAFDGRVFVRFGFSFPELVTSYGESWRLLTAIFLHFNLWHILFNAIALFQVGQFVERIYGSARFFLIFVVTGLLGNFLELQFMPPQAVLGGASGAVFGLIGCCGLYAHRSGNSPLRRVMFQWALYAFLFGFFIRAANLAHFGGFAAGLVAALIVPPYRFGRSLENLIFRVLALCVAIAVMASFVIVFVRYRF